MPFEKSIVSKSFVRVTTEAGSATGAVSKYIFIADKSYEVIGFQAIWVTASSSGTIDLVKCTGTTVVGSGTSLLVSTYDTSGAAATLGQKTVGNAGITSAARFLKAGDKLAWKVGGTMTNIVGLITMVTLRPIAASASIY